MTTDGGAMIVSVRLDPGEFLAGSKEMTAAIQSLRRRTKGLGDGLRAAFSGLSLRGLSEAAGQVKRLSSAMKALPRQLSSANGAIDGMSRALERLRNSLYAASAPVMTVVAPALTSLIDRLAEGANRVGAFVAALSGQSVFTRAARGQDAYAKSLGRSSGAARSLKRQLASFDSLDILSRSSGGRSGGGGIGSAFETVPIEDGILSLAGRIRELFAAGEYEEIGRVVARGVNGALERARELIRWERVGEVMSKTIGALTGIFNGLVDGVDWTSVGGTLAAGVGTALHAAELLLTGIRWEGVGRAIGEALAGLARDIDWELFGRTLAELMTLKLRMIASAALSFDWTAAALGLSEGFNRFLERVTEVLGAIPWEEVAQRVTDGLNLAAETVDWEGVGTLLATLAGIPLRLLKRAVMNFKWGEAGAAFARTLNGLQESVDWEGLGLALNGLMEGALDFLVQAAADFDWKGFGENLSVALGKIDWVEIGEKLMALISEGMRGLAEAMGGDLWQELLRGTIGAGGVMKLLGLGRKKNRREEKRAEREEKSGVGGALAGLLGHSGLDAERWQVSVPGLEIGVDFLPAANGSTRKNDGLLKYLQSIFAPGVDTTNRVALAKNGWTSLQSFVGTNNPLSALIGLAKHGWTLLTKYVGTDNPLAAIIRLVKSGWSLLSRFIGTDNPLAAIIRLVKSGWSLLSLFVGTNNPLSALIQLAKSGWSTLGKYVGTNSTLSAIIALIRASGWKDGLVKWLTGNKNGKVGITLALNSVGTALKNAAAKLGIRLATGGIITAGGLVKRFASGGAIMNSGRASWWSGVQKYAAGTRRAQGTLFVAGEAGPEVVGHVGGRTEVLNKSQLAQTMQSAVTVGMLTALRSITFKLPTVATNAVPYEVAAQAATSAADMQATLDANNEDLIQTIISVIGAQTTAIVAALQAMERRGASGSPLTAQQVINEINRRTQMFSASPLKGV
ncbi:MAG: hypothetical protein Q4C10_06305 [Clostridia bacterium]|nr:hypothetical protein [Clostridia bacterium]